MLLPLAISSAFILFMILFGLFAAVLTIVALIDILCSEFKENDKLIWVLVVIFLGPLGAILYYAMGQQQKLPKT